MQRAVQTDYTNDNRARDHFLKVRTDSRIDEQFQNEVEKKRAEHRPRITSLATENVCAAENDRPDHLQFESQRHARRFDGLNACDINQGRQSQKNSSREK